MQVYNIYTCVWVSITASADEGYGANMIYKISVIVFCPDIPEAQ